MTSYRFTWAAYLEALILGAPAYLGGTYLGGAYLGAPIFGGGRLFRV